MRDPIREIAARDGRYAHRAFEFLNEALAHTVHEQGRVEERGRQRHVSGQELLAGLRDHATRQFGPLAAFVWRSWGVRETLDWGRIVFLLVEHRQLKSQEGDTIEDFRDGFDFDEVFVEKYELRLPPEIVIQTPVGE